MFDDLFSGARSPGVIGILLGLVVIGGFGTLGAFVFDGRLNGEVATSIERRIDGLEQQIIAGQRRMEQIKVMVEAGDKRTDIANHVETTKSEISAKTAKKTELELAFDENKHSYEKLQKDVNRYRDQIRRGAEGEKVENLQTLEGRTYKTVTIKRVTDAGIEFSHETGSGRALFTALTLDWQKRFRYNPEEHSDALKSEQNVAEKHGEMVSKAQEEQQKRNEIHSLKADDDTRKYKASVLAKDISALESKVARLRGEYDRDVSRTSGASSSRIVVSKAGQISRDIAATEEQLAQKRRELEQVYAR